MELPELELDYKDFLNMSTLLYGESKGGKSTIIIDILYHLKPHVEQVVVFCPTDKLNNTYSAILPQPFIHYKIDANVITQIMERQAAFAEVYKRAQNPAIIERLFNIVADNEAKMIVRKLEASITKTSSAALKAALAEFKMKLWKHTITTHKSRLARVKLTEQEAHTLKYLNFNPNIAIIFDDCSDQLQKLSKMESIQQMFYQGRHNMVTFLIACHDDTLIPKGLRESAFVRVYTSPEMARRSLLRDKSKNDKETNNVRVDAIKSAFVPLESAKYQKLVYIRERNAFYRFTAKPRPSFSFCSPVLRRYCDMIKSDPNELSKNNPYMKGFI